MTRSPGSTGGSGRPDRSATSTATQLSALASLDLAGAMTPRELAEAERVQPPTMTKIVGKLEDRSLVQRTPHPTDRRQVILAVTPEGRAMLAEIRAGAGGVARPAAG